MAASTASRQELCLKFSFGRRHLNDVSLEQQLTSPSVTQKYLVSVLRYHIQNGVLSISPFSGANEQLCPPITLRAALIKSGVNQ